MDRDVALVCDAKHRNRLQVSPRWHQSRQAASAHAQQHYFGRWSRLHNASLRQMQELTADLNVPSPNQSRYYGQDGSAFASNVTLTKATLAMNFTVTTTSRSTRLDPS